MPRRTLAARAALAAGAVLLLSLLLQTGVWAWAPQFQDVAEKDMTATLRNWATALVGGLAAIFGVVLVGSILWLSKKLSVGAGNPQARAEAMSGYLWVLVAAFFGFAASTIAGLALWLANRG